MFSHSDSRWGGVNTNDWPQKFHHFIHLAYWVYFVCGYNETVDYIFVNCKFACK